MKTLLLNGKEVKNHLDMFDVLEAVEDVFREKIDGNVQMPSKMYLYYPKYEGDLRIMPSYLPALNVSAVKIVNVHPQNSRFGLKTVMASLLLIDPQTGFLSV
jgi:alanine dehydrogenase